MQHWGLPYKTLPDPEIYTNTSILRQIEVYEIIFAHTNLILEHHLLCSLLARPYM